MDVCVCVGGVSNTTAETVRTSVGSKEYYWHTLTLHTALVKFTFFFFFFELGLGAVPSTGLSESRSLLIRGLLSMSSCVERRGGASVYM